MFLAADLLRDGDALARTGALAAALTLSVWHALGVLCCAAARRWPERRSLVAATRWCPPLTRGIASATISAGIVLAPVAAHAQTTTTTASTPPAEAPFVRTPATPPATPVGAVPLPAPPVATGAPALSPSPARTHVVVPGDNLWRIAATEVQRVSGVERPTEATIATYWRAVLAANASTLRSGDPSLIYPGEVVTLPST